MKIKFAILSITSVVLLAGCTTPEGIYPSLAIRDGERMTGTMEPVAAEPYVAPATPVDVLDRIALLGEQAQVAHAAFLAEAPKMRPAITRGLAQEAGTESWASGQVALAGLETSRNKALIALADLDRLYADAVTNGGESEKIEAVRTRVLALISQQENLLSAMKQGEI